MSRYVDTRFWRWWRKVPIVVMAILLAVALAYQMAPGALLRQFLFPVQYADYIEESSERYGLDPYLVCAVIKCESNVGRRGGVVGGRAGADAAHARDGRVRCHLEPRGLRHLPRRQPHRPGDQHRVRVRLLGLPA